MFLFLQLLSGGGGLCRCTGKVCLCEGREICLPVDWSTNTSYSTTLFILGYFHGVYVCLPACLCRPFPCLSPAARPFDPGSSWVLNGRYMSRRAANRRVQEVFNQLMETVSQYYKRFEKLYLAYLTFSMCSTYTCGRRWNEALRIHPGCLVALLHCWCTALLPTVKVVQWKEKLREKQPDEQPEQSS